MIEVINMKKWTERLMYLDKDMNDKLKAKPLPRVYEVMVLSGIMSATRSMSAKLNIHYGKKDLQSLKYCYREDKMSKNAVRAGIR